MKRSIKSLLLVLALALLVGGYWVVTNMTTSVNVTQSSVSTAIVDKNAAISSISWTYEGEDITLVNNDGTWFLANDETYPINQNAVKTLMGSFTGVMAKQKIDGVSSLADYGLEEPAYTVTFTADDDDFEESVRIVTTLRRDPSRNIISNKSPLGSALLGHRVGDKVLVKIDDNNHYFAVIKKIEKGTDDDTLEIRKY